MTDTADALAALRKRESELTTALIDLQGRLHELRAAILAIERATGQRPATGRPRKPVQVIGLHHGRTGIDANGEPDPEPEGAA